MKLKHMTIAVAATLFFGGFASPVRAITTDCNVMWQQATEAEINRKRDEFKASGFTNRSGNRYKIYSILSYVHQQVGMNCPAFNQLPAEQQTQAGYAAYLLQLNPGIAPNGQLSAGSMIPRDKFNRQLRAGGITLGLPEGASAPAPVRRANTQSSERRSDAPVRREQVQHSIVPGCRSCSTAQGH